VTCQLNLFLIHFNKLRKIILQWQVNLNFW